MQALLELFGTVLLIQTGRAVVWVLSLGRWQSDAWNKRALVEAPAGALSYVHDGRRIVTQTGAILVGGASYAALFGAVVYVLGGR